MNKWLTDGWGLVYETNWGVGGAFYETRCVCVDVWVCVCSCSSFPLSQEYSIMAVGILCLIISSLTWSVAPYFFGRVIDQAKPMKTNW